MITGYELAPRTPFVKELLILCRLLRKEFRGKDIVSKIAVRKVSQFGQYQSYSKAIYDGCERRS